MSAANVESRASMAQSVEPNEKDSKVSYLADGSELSDNWRPVSHSVASPTAGCKLLRSHSQHEKAVHEYPYLPDLIRLFSFSAKTLLLGCIKPVHFDACCFPSNAPPSKCGITGIASILQYEIRCLTTVTIMKSDRRVPSLHAGRS